MNILPLPPDIPVLIIDNFYSETELNLIWKEINFLTEESKFKPPKDTGSAKDANEKYLKTAHGILLDKIYADRSVSNILQCNRKIFSDDFISLAININPLYCILKSMSLDNSLLNYYEDGEEYKKHIDHSIFTAITMLFKDENKFTGGDFMLHNFDMLIKKLNNRMVLFPGVLEHSVTPIKMIGDYEPFGGFGRYTITQFMSTKY